MSGTSLPPGPSAPPAVQTARWLFRPIEFLDSCRRRHGDAFSVKFLGFETPMVMLCDPEAIKALYRGRENGLPPGRSFALEPVMGARSVLLLEGARAPVAAQADAAAVSRRADARLRVGDRRGRARRDRLAGRFGEAFPIHPRMQAVTLEVILRAVFGVTDPSSGARRCAMRSGRHARRHGLAAVAAARSSPRAASAARTRSRSCGATRGPSTSCSTPRSPSGAPTRTSPSATTSSRCWSPPASRTASR